MIRSSTLAARRRAPLSLWSSSTKFGYFRSIYSNNNNNTNKICQWPASLATSEVDSLAFPLRHPDGVTIRTFTGISCGSNDDDSQPERRRDQIFQKAIPKIQVISSDSTTTTTTRTTTSFVPTESMLRASFGRVRGMATAATTNSSPSSLSLPSNPAGLDGKGQFGSKQVDSASLSSSSSSGDDKNSKDDEQQQPKTWREKYEEHTARLRVRAGQLRDNAQESWGEFKEHPGQSMKSGAKSFSGMMRIYGPVFFGVHVSVYFATLGLLFVGIDSGALDPSTLMQMIGNTASDTASETKNTVDYVVEWMKNHSWTQDMAPVVARNPHMANLAVAWIAIKFTEPIRLPVSIFLTPRVARYFGRGPVAVVEETGEEGAPATQFDGDKDASDSTKTTTASK